MFKKDFSNIFIISFKFCSLDDVDTSFLINESYHNKLPVMISICSLKTSINVAFDFFSFKGIDLSFFIEDLMSRFFENLFAYSSAAYSLNYVYQLDIAGLFIVKYYKKKYNIGVDVLLKDNIIYKIAFWINSKYFVFLNFNNVLPVSLEDAALSFNSLNKIIYSNILSFNFFNLIQYTQLQRILWFILDNETRVLLELLFNYNSFMANLFHLPVFNHISLYSYNFSIFQKNYLLRYKVKNLTEDITSFIQASYTGGVCDVYRPFGLDIVFLDVSSMYSHIMLFINLGLGQPTWINNIENLETFTHKHPCFIKVKVWCSTNMKFPLLCVKDIQTGKIVQATGSFIVTVWGKELLYCLKNYKQFYRFEVVNALFFTEQSSSIFSNYVLELYSLRLSYSNLDTTKGFLFKTMLNSLSGRFGLRSQSSFSKVLSSDEEICFVENHDIEYKNTLKLSEDLILLNYTQTQYNKTLNSSFSRLDWASAITSEARILIQKFKDVVDIYYVDTDAIVIRQSDILKLNNFIFKNKCFALGKLKVIYLCSFGFFVGTRTYLLGVKSLNSYFSINKSLSDIIAVLSKIELFSTQLNAAPLSIEDNSFFDIFLEDSQINLSFDKRLKLYKDRVWVDTGPLELNYLKNMVRFF